MIRRGKAGVTLLELVVTVAMISFGLLAATRLFVSNFQAVESNWRDVGGVQLANQIMDRVRSMPWDALGPAGSVPTASATISAVAGTPPANVGEWNNYSDTVEDYARSVTVEFVSLVLAGGVDVVTPVAGPTDYKRVRVAVSKRGARPFVLETVLANAAA